MLRPLRHRDFRLMWAGMTLSLVGEGVLLVAVAWQVIALGGSPVTLSLVVTGLGLGLVLAIVFAGVVADRFPRRLVMLASDLARALLLLAIAGLSLSGVLEPWMLAIGTLLLGASEAFFAPAFAALVPMLVPDDELVQANALDMTVRQLSTSAAGPLLGGLLLGVADPGWALLACAGAFLVSAGCLAGMRERGVPDRGATPEPPLQEFRSAWTFVRERRWLWGTLVASAVSILAFLGPLDVLVPFLVKDRLGGGATAYGLVLAAAGAGAVLAAVVMSRRGMPRRYMTVMLVGWGIASLPLVFLGGAPALWFVALVLAASAAGDVVGMVIWTTLLQRRVPDRMRGRVSSLDWFVSLSLLPVSTAVAGPAGEALGLTPAFVLAGVIPALASAAVLVGLGLRADELAHPLHDEPAATQARSSEARSSAKPG